MSDLPQNLKATESKASTAPKNSVKRVIWPSSVTGGAMPINIESRFANERHRLSEDFTEKWRQYRIKYIKSMLLERKEPRDFYPLYKEFYNPIRRFCRAPLDYYQKVAKRYIGAHYARTTRHGIAIFTILYGTTLWFYHAIMYGQNTNNWETSLTIVAGAPRPVVLPGDPDYPLKNNKPYDWQFYDNGFSKRKSHLDI